MRGFLLRTCACTLVLLASFARAQQIDIAVGATTLLSSSPSSASEAYLPPPEKGGTYPGVSADVILKNHHFGFNAEISARSKEGLYNGYQRFRPVLYDLNGVYARRLAEKVSAEVMAGVGGERVLFYSRFSGCNPDFSNGCAISVSSNHFLFHVGTGVSYYFWHKFFIRPEAHLYVIPNNNEFSSGNIGRVGASIGYTFRSR